MKILHIEDSEGLAFVINNVIKSNFSELVEDLSITRTATGELGIELVKKESLDFIIVDLIFHNNNEMLGGDIIEEINKLCDTQIILLTGLPSTATPVKNLLSKNIVYKFTEKSSDMGNFIKSVSDVLGLK